MSDINVPLLRKALEHITAHPEEWRQGDWAIKCERPVDLVDARGEADTFCGTAFCLAGHVAVMSGHELLWRKSWDLVGLSSSSRTISGDHISEVSRKELGLTERQAGILFAGSNSLRTLWTLASLYSDGGIEIPEDFR